MGQSKGFRARLTQEVAPTKEELTAGFETNQILRLNQRILDGKAVVTKVINDTSFVIYHEDFRRDFIITAIDANEDIKSWVKMQMHTNIVTAFDTFIETTSGEHFIMVEENNGGTMFNYIRDFGEQRKMDLAIDVPRSYIELVFDVAIQLATALDFAHNNGLIHGQFDLSKVFIETMGKNVIYKIGDFAPKTSMDLPVSTEANYWPFSKQKKELTEREKSEVIMLKDIYSLGIAILELMIGRTSKQKFHISLESLPLTWAEFPESTPLIQVLVDCIQIDSITQRKGRLASIRKLLIREYKKFFQKPFYKMEHPYIGKKADVYNKRGIVSLFNGNATEAINCWHHAHMLSDRHFDSATNFNIYRWSTGQISDQELMNELSSFVFDVPGKGETLHGYLLIAIGQRDEGLSKINDFLSDEDNMREAKLAEEKKTPVNQKLVKLMQDATAVKEAVKLDREAFPANAATPHNHKERVQHMSFCQTGVYMASTCTKSTKVWKVANSLMGCFCTIPNKNEQQQSTDYDVKQLCAIDNAGTTIVIYRGMLQVHIYTIKEQGGDRIAELTQTVDLLKEIQANGEQNFRFEKGHDQVLDMRFLGTEETQGHLRVYLMVGGQHYFADVKVADGVTELAEASMFEDRSVLKETEDPSGTLKRRQETLKKLILEEMNEGNDLMFPSNDNRIVVVKKQVNPKGDRDADDAGEGEEEGNIYKHYKVYDIVRESFIRRINKETNLDDAACLNESGSLMIYCEKEQFLIQAIRVPNSSVLVDRLRPRFAVAEAKLNPAQASLNRQSFKDRVYRELHAYHVFKEDPQAEKHLGLKEEQNVQLMVMRYEEAVMAQYKLKANRELMMLQKVLLRDAAKAEKQGDLQKHCPLIGVEGIKRIETYDDELKFASNKAMIEYVEMSSEPHRHFFLIGMQNRIYKYDVVTTELLFSFHSDFNEDLEKFRAEVRSLRNKKKRAESESEENAIQAQIEELEHKQQEQPLNPIKNAMHLWDKDDKLVCVSDEEIRLWDFYDHKEQAPELLTLHQTGLKVEAVYINKHHNHETHPLYICVTEGNKFIVYESVKQRADPINLGLPGNKRKPEEEVPRYTYALRKCCEGELSDEDGNITTADYSKPGLKAGEGVKILLGTTTGRIITYSLETGRDPNHFQAGEINQSITQITCLQCIPEDEVYLMTIESQEIKLYNQTKNQAKEVDFGPDGEKFVGKKICKVAVASNNKFFMVGIPDQQVGNETIRAIGWFGLNRNFLTCKPLKWITKYQFSDMIVDDHLSTMMLLDSKHKQLDYFYILWKFATDKIPDKRKLEKMDEDPVEQETESNMDTQDGLTRSEVQRVKGAACCSIF